jgi:hypothetical protein
MKTMALLGAILVLSSSAGSAQIAKGYVTGTLVNVEESTDDTLNKGTTLRSSFENYTVRIGDMTYTAYCAEKLITSHCDSNFVIGGPVQARVEGEHLYIVRSNGKEQKAKIFRSKYRGLDSATVSENMNPAVQGTVERFKVHSRPERQHNGTVSRT